MRGFEKVSIKEFNKSVNGCNYNDIKIPMRKTKGSAGYDFYLINELKLLPGEQKKIATGIKAYMQANEVLLLVVRSSLANTFNLRLVNQIGVIDSDYYNNKSNEGHIFVLLENAGIEKLILPSGSRFIQGLFLNYLTVNNEDLPKDTRKGGFGSTG